MSKPDSPRYRLAWPVFAGLAAAVICGRKRNFQSDARKLLAGLDPPLRVMGEKYVPCTGPGVITANHYCSPTFWAPWLGIAISAVTPEEITWTMTGAWTYPGQPLSRIRRRLSQTMLVRVAQVYGFISMPPMPPDPAEVAERGTAVRRLLEYVRQNPTRLYGLAPEGGDQPGGVLSIPPVGVGRLGLALDRLGMAFYPVGVFEENGYCCLNFGPAYSLEVDPAGDRKIQDLRARQRMMAEISALLPVRLRGEFTTLRPTNDQTSAGSGLEAV